MISIIVPTYNEEKNIMRFQENLKNLKGDFEVIFSDGFSSDNTYDMIEFDKIRETRFRSNQMNAAVKYAKGDVLWFVHADSIVHPDSVIAIENANAEAGCFRLKFDETNFLQNIFQFCSNYRVLSRNIAFGDQGIFITRKLFDKIGGYKPLPIMEDYELSICLKEHEIPFRQINLPIITSSRRYLEHGRWETNKKMQRLQQTYRRARKKGDEKYLIEKIYEEYEGRKVE